MVVCRFDHRKENDLIFVALFVDGPIWIGMADAWKVLVGHQLHVIGKLLLLHVFGFFYLGICLLSTGFGSDQLLAYQKLLVSREVGT